MAATAEKLPPARPPEAEIRRFQLPDLFKHGSWMVKRLLSVYPHKTREQLEGWLRGIIAHNEFLFLYSDHGVALGTFMREDPLSEKPHFQEIFVLAQDGHKEEAAAFYDEFVRWSKQLGITVMVVEVMSDVPHEAIKARTGRIFTRELKFARL